MKINIINTHKRIILRKASLRRLIEKICLKVGIARGSVSFVFTDNRRIKALNNKYFKKNRATDVISFNLADSIDPSNLRAEIIISLDEVKINSRRFDNSENKELLLYIIHGLLHLVGFKDKTAPQIKKMRKKEKQLLSFFSKSQDRLLKSILVG